MKDDKVRIFPLGDSALTVEFGNTISHPLNEKAIALADVFEQAPFPGYIESVPAYSSTTIFYDVVETRRSFPEFQNAFEAVKSIATTALSRSAELKTIQPRNVEIPVCFDNESAPDLDHVARQNGISPQEVIDIFTSVTYRVFMLGFLPGFTYMGIIDDRIATPRKETPRTSIPKGSVGIAGNQTGIYSLDSPGGWQIIGRTDIEMFTLDAETPSFLQPGDNVNFIAIK